MKKNVLLSLIFILCAAGFSQEFFTEKTPGFKEYVMYAHSYDWGCGVDFVVCDAGVTINPAELKKENFSVKVVLTDAGQTDSARGRIKGERTVLEVFPCDEYGQLLTQASRYLALKLKTVYEDEFSDMFVRNFFNSGNSIYMLRIENRNLNLKITKLAGIVSPAAEFKIQSITKNGVTLKYASWNPPQQAVDTPLIIWFHGIAEGGDNPYLPLLGLKATALISENIQKYFPEGACVIIPQCPTGWLETVDTDMFGMRVWAPVDIGGSVNRGVDKARKFTTGLNFMDESVRNGTYELPEDSETNTDPDKKPFAAVSYYTEVAKAMIDSYIARNPYIDTKRIYVGGCSAGGYMTMNMLIQFPDFFAAGFPVCEAYPDSKITDAQIKKLAELPLWFTHAKNDETIKIETHDGPTYERIKKAGASDLHYSLFENVIDSDGVEIDGHSSWAYVLNNRCEENGITIFEWLSKQKR